MKVNPPYRILGLGQGQAFHAFIWVFMPMHLQVLTQNEMVFYENSFVTSLTTWGSGF